MSANIRLHVTSQRHINIMMIIAIQCNSLCTNYRFLKTGFVDHIGVLQTPIILFGTCTYAGSGPTLIWGVKGHIVQNHYYTWLGVKKHCQNSGFELLAKLGSLHLKSVNSGMAHSGPSTWVVIHLQLSLVKCFFPPCWNRIHSRKT